MRLSDAVMLGDSLKKADAHHYLRKDWGGNVHGCALGGAVLAVGLGERSQWEALQRRIEYLGLSSDSGLLPGVVGLRCFRERWPWVTVDIQDHISAMYYKVVHGTIRLEELVSWIRSVEPAEAEVTDPAVTIAEYHYGEVAAA